MKKLLLLVLATIIVATVCSTAVAFANTNALSDKIKQLDGVDDVRIATCNDLCVVAVKPKGVMQKSQCDKLRQEIAKTVKAEKDSMQVVVTFSVKAFCHIEKIEQMPEDKRQAELDKLIDRLSKIPMPLKIDR